MGKNASVVEIAPPSKNVSESRITDESEGDYAARIGAEFGFPEEVLTQWISPHYFNQDTVNNDAWLAFTTVELTKERWTTERFCGLRVIEAYRDFVDEARCALRCSRRSP